MTQEMIDYIRTTPDRFQQADAGPGFGQRDRRPVRHRRPHRGLRRRRRAPQVPRRVQSRSAAPDRRVAGLASPRRCRREYDVNEIYSEFSFPVLAALDLTAAIRYSDYSTFGNATTGKAGFRWQPIEDLVIRGTYSEGFRAPNLGELFGLTQFGATLVDPCGSTGSPGPAVAGNSRPAACAQGAPPNFEQANTQITTFTGGNPNLEPEESDSYTFGVVYSPSWAEDHRMVGPLRLRAELLPPRDRRRDPGARPAGAARNLPARRRRRHGQLRAVHRAIRSAATSIRRTTSSTTSARSRPTASTSRSTGPARNGAGAA